MAKSSQVSVSIADPDPADFVYFLDATSQTSVTPAKIGFAGEFKAADRAALTAAGRIVGESAALNQSAATGFNLWPLISGLFTSKDSVPKSEYGALAQSILKAVLQYEDEFPLPADGTPTANGGYSFWAQDFEFTPGSPAPGAPATPTNEVYAGVTAVLWAGRQVLGDNVKILPVMSSSLFKTLGDSVGGAYSAEQIAGSNGSGGLLASLGLTTPSGKSPLPDGEWNFLSFLWANGLIDGFFGQQYNLKSPGIVTPDTKPFSDTSIPYALISAHDNPVQVATGSWHTTYNGDIPFESMVYWSADVDPAWNTGKPPVLTPTQAPLPGAVFAAIARGG